jgi:preprotein translocase subunit SecB
LDIAIRGFITKDPTWQTDIDLNTELNMQLYYKSKDYEYEHEWRFAIKNERNNKQRFPFAHAILRGRTLIKQTYPNFVLLQINFQYLYISKQLINLKTDLNTF